MGRFKKYGTDLALRRAVEDYFDSISRIRVVMESRNIGRLDKYGHPVMEMVAVKNNKGEDMTEREYVIPPTVGGLCHHLKISRETWSQYCGLPMFEETTTWAKEQMLSWREKELMTRPGKDVKGLLFDLRANYGVSEKTDAAKQERSGDDPLTRSIKEAVNDGIL